MEEKDILEMLFGFSEEKKVYIIMKKKKNEWEDTGEIMHSLKICFIEMENLVNFSFFHLYPITS